LVSFLNTVGKIQFLLKSDKTNDHFKRGPIHICDHISLSSLRMRKVSEKTSEKSKDTFYDQ